VWSLGGDGGWGGRSVGGGSEVRTDPHAPTALADDK